MVDIVVVDLGVEEGFDAGFEPELGVVDFAEVSGDQGRKGDRPTFASGFDKLGETYAQDVGC